MSVRISPDLDYTQAFQSSSFSIPAHSAHTSQQAAVKRQSFHIGGRDSCLTSIKGDVDKGHNLRF